MMAFFAQEMVDYRHLIELYNTDVYNLYFEICLSTNDKGDCETHTEPCEYDGVRHGECFNELRSDRLVSSDSLKFCYDHSYTRP